MKLNAYSFAAGAVALSATTLAMPTLYRRIVDGSGFFKCMATAITSGSWPTACGSEVVNDIGLIQGVDVDDLAIDFTISTNPSIMGLSSSKLTANLIKIPAGFPYTSFPVTDSSQVDAGVEVAQFTTPTSVTTVVGTTVSTAVGNSQLNILPGQEDSFVAFMSKLIKQASLALTIKGKLDITITAKIPFSTVSKSVSIPNIAYSAPITLQGCNDFANVKFLKQISLTKDAAGQYTLTSSINIFNPSQLVLTMGDVKFNTIDKNGLTVGVTTFAGLRLAMGDNIVTAVTVFTSVDVIAGGTFAFQGFDGSSTNRVLAKALAGVKADITIPQLSPNTSA
ncbi:hypothetical protein BGZ80_009288 [Entomortierella chlamydospora]|uniref:Uncharacterized protein n=1 Tax=Entomortierella chlamydospora TaxID=101097 RepID=A0A9P6MWL2_9FUNG|nr:hypothetical protein BGZ79_009078 [Entomortierella chlamydospora]KAG0016356.1 hypothetical protein BGZ80_009288 [Entomortierella chlamydospora]